MELILRVSRLVPVPSLSGCQSPWGQREGWASSQGVSLLGNREKLGLVLRVSVSLGTEGRLS